MNLNWYTGVVTWYQVSYIMYRRFDTTMSNNSNTKRVTSTLRNALVATSSIQSTGDYADVVNDSLQPPLPASYTCDAGKNMMIKTKTKLSFPSLTVSITAQNYWAQRNRRRRGRLSIAAFVHRQRRLALLISFAVLFMTILSSLSSMLLLQQKQQLQQSLEQQHEKQLHTRRQLRTSAARTTKTLHPMAHYLSFGSSYASDDVIPYPYLLDTNVHSVSIPVRSSTGSSSSSYSQYVEYVAACTQSLVDGGGGGKDPTTTTTATSRSTFSISTPPHNNKVPNVITIEYAFEADLVQESYQVLIQRLRQRYPSAVIVLVQLLQDPSKYLHLVEYSQEEGSEPTVLMNFQQWWKSQQRSPPKTTTDKNDWIPSMFEEASSSNSGGGGVHWAMMTPPTTTTTTTNHASNKVVLSKLLELDRQILQYTNPLWVKTNFSNHEATFQEQMSLFWNHFTVLEDGSIGLSNFGHSAISKGVRKLVQQQALIRTTTNEQNDDHGDWGSGDDCHIWYINGDYRDIESFGGRTVDVPAVTNNEAKEYRQSLFGNMAGFVRNAFLPPPVVPHKHALEFSRSNPASYFDISSPNSNYIMVNNPFATPRLLSLSYLTDSDGMSYPKTLIVLNDVPSVQIQPIHELGVTNEMDDHNWQRDQDVAKTSSVGYIPPGKSMLRFLPLQNTALSFRVVGVSILAEELQHSTEYAFEMDATTVSVTDVIQQ